MVVKFQVVDTSKQHFEASAKMPAITRHYLHLMDLDTRAPMRQMPKYQLKDEEVERYGAGQANGKQVTIACREFSGTGNPRLTGEIIEVK